MGINYSTPVIIPPTLAQPADTVEPLPTNPPEDEATPTIVDPPTASPEDPEPTPTQPPAEIAVPVLSEMRFFDDKSDGFGSDFIASNEVFIEFDFANVADGSVLRRR